MSGITGDRYGGSYENMRDRIQGQDAKGGKLVRGDDKGNVGLHEGFSKGLGLVDGDRRKAERAQGGENVFRALRAKLGGDDVLARQIFNDIGRERNRDLRQEFKVSDFERIDDRLSSLERDRLDGFSRNWQRHVDVPRGLIGDYTRIVEKRELDLEKNGYNDYTEHWKTWNEEESYHGVSDRVDEAIRDQINARLLNLSHSGRTVLTDDQVVQVIREEVSRYLNR